MQKKTNDYLTDGGMETTLIFHQGIELPEFAAFHLLKDQSGRDLLRNYYRKYLGIAAEHQTGFILESPTWRANRDWGRKIGYDESELDRMNQLGVAEMKELRREAESGIPDILVSGCVGPRGDGYTPTSVMSDREAETYHSAQIRSFADGGVDLVTAMTLNYVAEAVGIVRAARACGLRPVISFTVETDGRLVTGETIRDAIEQTDRQTEAGAAWFMINCAHPTHFENAFKDGGDWLERIQGIRANASRLSHEELDNSETLDSGDPQDLGDRMRRIRGLLPRLNIYGGCCGTDHRHVEAMGQVLSRQKPKVSAE